MKSFIFSIIILTFLACDQIENPASIAGRQIFFDKNNEGITVLEKNTYILYFQIDTMDSDLFMNWCFGIYALKNDTIVIHTPSDTSSELRSLESQYVQLDNSGLRLTKKGYDLFDSLFVLKHDTLHAEAVSAWITGASAVIRNNQLEYVE